MGYRLGIISDLHADFGALASGLEHLHRLGCDQVICAGDVVDGDVFPDEVIARLAGERIPTIRGNHDRWALERARGQGAPELYGSGFDLSDNSISFLANLPTSLTVEEEGVRVVVWHASPGSDMEPVREGGELSALSRADADVLVVGHTHEPRATWTPMGLVCNPGALYRSATAFERTGPIYVPSGSQPGTFGVLDLPAMSFRVFSVTDGALVFEKRRE